MKNIILGSVLAVAAITSFSANADPICSGVALAGNGATVTGNTSGGSFVRTAFVPKCSANVFLEGIDGGAANPTLYRVGSASAKGKTRFNGSTVGGAVAPVSTADPKCPATPCTAQDAADAAGLAPSS
ncbi:MAG: hypothetical protein V5B39_20270 [Accumulibacter sp.]|jgi:hypothetical protein|uniref:hypothetical protein n=1 Tax=Accumulibacter sp. TaxID=2053492 RepID=UPI002FC2C550